MGSRPIRSLLFHPEPDEYLHEHGARVELTTLWQLLPDVARGSRSLEGLVSSPSPDSKYLVADGAFLSWFARQSPSTAIGGLYDLRCVFSTYSTAC